MIKKLFIIIALGILLAACGTSNSSETVSKEQFQQLQQTLEAQDTQLASLMATPTPTNTPTPAAPASHPAVVQPTPAASQPAATAGGYPLAGQKYTAWINGSADTSGRYDAVWTASGWLWQPNLPPEGHRKGHVLSITIEEGRYIFNGVSCRLHLDVSRNGQGANNPKTVGYGNGLAFTVDTVDNGQAWGFVVCDQTDVTGFSIQWLGPLP